MEPSFVWHGKMLGMRIYAAEYLKRSTSRKNDTIEIIRNIR
jgi:hypothetical protein